MTGHAWCRWVILAAVMAAVVSASGSRGTRAFSAQPPDANLFNPLAIPGLSGDSAQELVRLSGEYKIATGSRDGVLSIKALIKPEWHVYSTTQKAGGPLPSRIKVESSPDFQLTRPFVADRVPVVKPPDVFPVPSEEFSEEVIWSAPFRLADSADPAKLSFVATFDGLACQEGGSCVPLSKLAIPIEKLAGELPAIQRGEFSNPRVHAKIRGQVAPRTVVPGGVVKLTLTAEPAPGYHVYALADRDPMEVSKPSLIVWKRRSDWSASPPQPSEKPIEPADGGTPYHEQPISWTVELRVPDDAAAAGYELRGLIGYQTCKSNLCDRPAAAEFTATVAVVNANVNVKPGDPVDPAPEPLNFTLSTYDAAAKLAAESTSDPVSSQLTQPQPQPTSRAPNETPAAPSSSAEYSGPLLEIPKLRPVGQVDEAQSMFIVLPTAFLAGFILNFMPCVLPVIGLKIISFVQQAGESRSRIFMLNVWYSLGLLSVFLVLATLAVFAGFGWGKQFQSATFNIVLASVVFAFALSFLGVWEIPLPGFVGTSGANKAAQQEGPTGAFFKGALTTVLATPCTGPLLVPTLAWALKQPPVLTYAAFVCVGLGMAAPYLVLGAFPKLISFLPKPGEWMETFKQLMGFVLIGTVVYLLTIIPIPLVVPTVAFLMGLWAAMWWIGRVPVWDELHKRIRAWAVGGAFATLIGMFAFNWLGNIMEDRFHRDVAAAISNPALNPAKMNSTIAVGAGDSRELPWRPYSLQLLSQLLLTEKKTVLVDFTADWCWNCKLNERVALNVPGTKSFVQTHRIETIKADMTHDSSQIDSLLQQLTGTTAIPVYAIFRPDDPYQPIVITGILTQSGLLDTLSQATDKSAAAVVAAK